MEVINHIAPANKQQLLDMQKQGPDGPIYMINLLKFRDKAKYEDGRETSLTGREAYEIYGREVSKLIRKFGGEVQFAADVTFLSLGEIEELWDEVAIATYPNRLALWEMSTSKEWRAISVHRTAGLKGQLNIETAGSAEWMNQPEST